ncbi:class I SAM-dependent methyltransferase [Aestuariirhabdus sp. LZHN29]|uniref:class I SAM-dependent methyltransferase n=1 Tax=Aestuariirhabdus sp. LZHN29 TaxID=3417462 RepID=UPI003CEF81DA
MSKSENIFRQFSSANLVNVTPEELKANLQGRLGEIDFESEGYLESELEQQRDLSIKFHWGHDHDFGDFKIDGRMGNRHLYLFDKFLELFPLTVGSFENKHVLDIGCWTGGTTLLLSAISEKVTAVEEVKKYADTTRYLSNAFGCNAEVISESLYDLNSERFYDQFDCVYFPGVIYHLSDPVLALRILFNTLRIGGDILIETAGIQSDEPICRFDGNYIYHQNGTREELNRGGWNYFIMSGPALERMMQEAGFEQIQTFWDETSKRLFAYGKKDSQIGICKAGLSVPDIK